MIKAQDNPQPVIEKKEWESPILQIITTNSIASGAFTAPTEHINVIPLPSGGSIVNTYHS